MTPPARPNIMVYFARFGGTSSGRGQPEASLGGRGLVGGNVRRKSELGVSGNVRCAFHASVNSNRTLANCSRLRRVARRLRFDPIPFAQRVRHGATGHHVGGSVMGPTAGRAAHDSTRATRVSVRPRPLRLPASSHCRDCASPEEREGDRRQCCSFGCIGSLATHRIANPARRGLRNTVPSEKMYAMQRISFVQAAPKTEEATQHVR
jgi:hypothetical protein